MSARPDDLMLDIIDARSRLERAERRVASLLVATDTMWAFDDAHDELDSARRALLRLERPADWGER